MTITQRLRAAWRGLTGQRDPYAATYGSGGVGGFAGGAVGRLTASLASWSGAINADLDASLPILRARARSLAANNEHGKRFLSLVAANVVGRNNPKLQVRALRDQRDPNKPTTLDKAANAAIEAHWERWGRTADITGRHGTLYALLRTLVKGVARDGEALVRVIRNRKLPYGMALQLLEADRLDETINRSLDNGNSIRQGVEIDSALRPVAYWIKTSHPGENYATRVAGVERIPAGELYHLYTQDRAEQVRGVTWFHAVIVRASVIHNFEEAAVVAAQIGASKIAALERSEEAPDAIGMMADGSSAGLPQMKVEAGELFELPPGYKLNSWNPEYPHANFESFLKACLRGLAAGWDVAAHNLTGDMTDVNYSSARIAELAERETWMLAQDWLISAFLQPLYEDWLRLALLSGAITFDITGKALPADRYQKFASASRFQGRRWAWVDPSKEADAQEKLLANLLTSRTRIAAEQGEEFDDILDELAAEDEAIDAAGLSGADDPPPAAPTAPPVDPAMDKLLAATTAMMVRSAQPAPPVVIHQAPVTVTSPTVQIDNHLPAAEVRVEAVMPEQTAPNVEVRVEAVMPEQAAPNVEVRVENPPAEVNVHLPARRTEGTIERDASGNIVRTTTVEVDA